MEKTFIQLYQPESGPLNIPYQPDTATDVQENPPRFTWMPAKLDEECYVLEIASSSLFDSATTIRYKPIYYNFFTPDQVLEIGTYYWRYALVSENDERVSSWSEVRSFEIVDGLPKTPLQSQSKRFANVSTDHPRLWLSGDEFQAFKKAINQDRHYSHFGIFYEKSVEPYMNLPLTKEPLPYPNHMRVATLWRQMYLDCQEVLYAIRHLSVAGVLLDDQRVMKKAKEWLLHVSHWDPNGTTSRDYNDEAAFRVAGALAWGYDWLANELDEDEKQFVRKQLFIRTQQVANHVMERSKIHHVPYDSHAVRSLSSVLVPCCIALFDEEPEARRWLHYTIEYYSGLYTPWGGADGGWAEGPHYWMTGMAYVIEAMNLVKKFNGYNLYDRPFFKKTGDFPLYVYQPYTKRASFGDHANLGDNPGLKVGFNIRQFAGVTGNGYYQWYYEQTKKTDTNPYDKFFNKGWWDFYFDDMMYHHDYPLIDAKEPSDLPAVKWFKDIGWVSINHRMDSQLEGIKYLTKSSPYGSISHSHGDQNTFVLHAYGDPLAIHSGYYIAFNSTMHMNWRRQTISKNGILIDGKGQYAGKDKFLAKAANGFVETVEESDQYVYMRADATNAYRHFVPYLKSYKRETYFVDQSYFILVDTVSLEQEAEVTWLLHALNEMELKDQTFTVRGESASLEGQFVYCTSGQLRLEQHNDFPDVDMSELKGMPIHWRLQAQTHSSSFHRIVTLLHPMKREQPKYVSYFVDDQDHGLQFYFTEDGKTFRLEIPKVY